MDLAVWKRDDPQSVTSPPLRNNEQQKANTHINVCEKWPARLCCSVFLSVTRWRITEGRRWKNTERTFSLAPWWKGCLDLQYWIKGSRVLYTICIYWHFMGSRVAHCSQSNHWPQSSAAQASVATHPRDRRTHAVPRIRSKVKTWSGCASLIHSTHTLIAKSDLRGGEGGDIAHSWPLNVMKAVERHRHGNSGPRNVWLWSGVMFWWEPVLIYFNLAMANINPETRLQIMEPTVGLWTLNVNSNHRHNHIS